MLGPTYDVRFRLTEKPVVDFILVLIDFYSPGRLLGLRRHERISIEKRRFCSNRVSLAQNFRDHPSTTILIVEHQECSFMWYKNLGMCVLHFVTIHAFGTQTDGQKTLVIPCVTLHAVARKMVIN